MIISISIGKKFWKASNIIKISTHNIPGLERYSFKLINGVHKNGHHMASGLLKYFYLKLGKRKGCRNQLKVYRLAHSFLIWVSWTLANILSSLVWLIFSLCFNIAAKFAPNLSLFPFWITNCCVWNVSVIIACTMSFFWDPVDLW